MQSKNNFRNADIITTLNSTQTCLYESLHSLRAEKKALNMVSEKLLSEQRRAHFANHSGTDQNIDVTPFIYIRGLAIEVYAKIPPQVIRDVCKHKSIFRQHNEKLTDSAKVWLLWS